MSSNLPTVQRFYSEDYKSAPDWFRNEFLRTLNLFTQAIYNIDNQGVDVMQNTRDELYQFSLKSVGVPSKDIFSFVPKKFVGTPSGIVIGQCIAQTSVPTPVGAAVTLDWIIGGGGLIKILAIYGLTNGVTYSFTLRLF